MRAEILKVRTDIASQMVQAGDFVTPAPGLTVYAREIGADSTLKDVMIYDARAPENITTHMAKTGEVQRTPSQVTLSLKDGSVQQALEDGSLDVIEFENYVIDLSEVMAMDNVLRLKTSDRFLHELLRPDPREFADREFKRELAAEGHARLSAPLYNIALVLLALCFMVRGEHLRLGYSRRIAVCASLGFVIRLTGFGVASAAESDRWLNIIQYCLPLIVIAYCTFYLMKRKRVRSLGRAKRAREYAVKAAQTPDASMRVTG